LAVKEDSNFVEAYLMLAEGYSYQKKCEKSCYYYGKVIEKGPDFSYRIYMFAAYEEMRCGNPAQAVKYFETYFERIPKNQTVQKEFQDDYELCLWREEMMKKALPITLKNMGENINSSWGEYYPTLTVDESWLIYTVLRPSDKHTKSQVNKKEEDFYISLKINDEWQPRKKLDLPMPLNTSYNEGASCISPDGKYLVFTSCHRDDGFGSCDLYWSKRIGDSCTKPRNFGAPVNTKYWESQPTFAADGKTIFFVSGRPGGIGGKDIWKTTMLEEGLFSEPVNLGRPINTPADEITPFFHPNGVTLYFASTGHRGMGGEDLFYSTLSPDGSWSEPVNLGYPINTIDNEMGLIVNAMGDKAFISADKKGGLGSMDLYWFEMPEALRPIPSVTYFKGRIFDNNDDRPLEAVFELIDLETKKVVVSSTSDPSTGEFLVCLPTNSRYALNVSKNRYLFHSENFEINGEYSKMQPYQRDVFLKRMESDVSVILKNVFFEFNKWELKPESQVELDKLFTLLKQNPQMRIEISGHTDNIGGEEHNLTLSENRAKAVFNYLVSKGIREDRMRFAGYGYSTPIAPNDTEEGRATNRRTEFKIVGF
jgi:outer membrane protein OmpA-like peptidoglycan-associated protein